MLRLAAMKNGHFLPPPPCIWEDHDLKLAREMQERIDYFSQRIVVQLGVSGVKHACDFNGNYGNRARSPLLPVTSQERSPLESLLAGIRN